MGLPHFFVKRAILQKFLMCSGCLDPPLIHHHKLIRSCHRIKSMSDHNQSLALYQFRNSLLNQTFILRVKVSCCLIENNNRGIFQHGSGDGNSLSFTPRQVAACTAHNRVIPMLQTHDEVMTTALSGNIFYFRPGHETYPTYHQPLVQKVICNGVRWAFNPEARLAKPTDAPNRPVGKTLEPLEERGPRLHHDGEAGYR